MDSMKFAFPSIVPPIITFSSTETSPIKRGVWKVRAIRCAARSGVVSDGTNIFVADSGNHTIRMIVIATGDVSTIAGFAGSSGSTDGTSGASARFSTPTGLALDTTGHFLYVSDQNFTKIRKIFLGGVTPTAASVTVSTLNASF
jgi:DNA-binding beta-propeller fold protein YncE